MKKILLLIMCIPAILSAQTNGVTVGNLVVNTGSPTTVTFDVSWKPLAPPTAWSDTVWVFVDHNDNGTMKRLELSAGATLTATSAPDVGRVEQLAGNNTGVRVIGDARANSSFSATVQLLTATTNVSGACAYASNYPPVAEYATASSITFTGTPPFDLVLSTGNVSVQTGYELVGSQTLVSFTDKTGAPGIIKCIPPATYSLIASASGFCTDDAVGITFSLDGTQSGVKYQLYRGSDKVGNELTGTGGAATFTGGPFNVAGTYTAQSVAEGLTCAIAMNGTHVVIENPLPDDPEVYNATRDCPGTVTLSASSPGAVIDWYVDADAASSFHTGASHTTPEIYMSTTYYVQARVENTGCLSARVPVVAEVNMEGCCDAPESTVNFTAFNPCASAATNSAWYLTDTRENDNEQTYKVKLMADGRYWMVQDMKFGNKCNNTNTQSKSDVTGKVSDIDVYYGECISVQHANAPANRGYLYDWAAAMNKPGAYYGASLEQGCTGTSSGTVTPNPGACQGICPLGWHLPTSDEYVAAYVALELAYSCSDKDCWPYITEWLLPYGSSAYCGSNPSYPATSPLHWTSTKWSNISAHSWIGLASTVESHRCHHMTVRCLRNYY